MTQARPGNPEAGFSLLWAASKRLTSNEICKTLPSMLPRLNNIFRPVLTIVG